MWLLILATSLARQSRSRARRRRLSVARDCFGRPIAGTSVAGFLRLSRPRAELLPAFRLHAGWVRDGQPTRQALAIIDLLKQADSQGLDPEDYDGSRWADRLARLAKTSCRPATGAIFDAALTVCLMRYISDSHIGKINPEHFKFGLSVEAKKYDLPAFLRERLVNGGDVNAELAQIGPPFAGYKRTLEALQHYLQLAREDDGEKLPVPNKPIAPGSPYDGIPRLTRLLRLLGDLPANAAVPGDSNLYQGALVDAVKSFQSRHGLKPDGRLDDQTLTNLNTPLSQRVDQLRLTLERWHWLPDRFTEPPIVVNIPEFRLRAYDSSRKPCAHDERDCRQGIPPQDACLRKGHAVCDLPPVLECSAEHPALGDRARPCRKTAITLPRKDSR